MKQGNMESDSVLYEEAQNAQLAQPSKAEAEGDVIAVYKNNGGSSSREGKVKG